MAALALRAVRRLERVRWPRVEVRDVVMIALVGACLLFSAHEVNSTEHKFCQIARTATAHPVARPASPRANPSRENAYIFYAEFVTLRRELGCG
jgi:hypothetical protein